MTFGLGKTLASACNTLYFAGTRVYIAGKWQERTIIKELMDFLKELGYEITCDWTWHTKDDSDYPSGFAVEDIEGVKNCDVFIGLFERELNYKGALVEMGCALGLDKRVWIIGHGIDSCLFASHPLVRRFANIEVFMEWIKRGVY